MGDVTFSDAYSGRLCIVAIPGAVVETEVLRKHLGGNVAAVCNSRFGAYAVFLLAAADLGRDVESAILGLVVQWPTRSQNVAL